VLSGSRTKEHENKKTMANANDGRATQQRPRNLEKKTLNLITPSAGAWQHKSARALLSGVHQTAKVHGNNKKEGRKRCKRVVKMVNL